MGNIRNKYKKFNSQVVNRLIEKHSLTGYYIRQCLKGERNSETSDTVRKDYNRLARQVKNVLNE